VAPNSRNGVAAAARTSNTTMGYDFCASRRAMAEPMAPKPMKPMRGSGLFMWKLGRVYGVVAQLMGHKPNATAEQHYTVRPLDLFRVHH
jgi:hypothetical protein